MNPTENRIVAASQAMRKAIVELSRALIAVDACAGYTLDEHPEVEVHIYRKRVDAPTPPATS